MISNSWPYNTSDIQFISNNLSEICVAEYDSHLEMQDNILYVIFKKKT